MKCCVLMSLCAVLNCVCMCLSLIVYLFVYCCFYVWCGVVQMVAASLLCMASIVYENTVAADLLASCKGFLEFD